MFDTSHIEQQNPHSQRAWWNCIQVLESLSERCRVYETALAYMPGSYKLWYHYLTEIRLYVDCNPSLEHYELANTLHERALTHMYLMPQIWLDYTEFLASQGHITKTRKVYDLALQRLPLTQHDLIWESYLVWAHSIQSPETAKRIFVRYLQLNPSYAYDYVDYLVKYNYVPEAVVQIQSLLLTDDSPQLWERLAKLISENPDCVPNSSGILESCKSKIEEKGKAWELVAEFYLRLGDIENARKTYEDAFKSLNSVKEFSIIFAAYTQLEEELASLDDPDTAEEAMSRLEELLNRRELLLSDIKLRENPNDVQEWISRSELFQDDIVQRLRIYAEAVTVLDPLKARGQPQRLWINFAKIYEEFSDYKNARTVFFKGTLSKLKKSDQIAEIWEEWIEFELRHNHYDDALKLIRKVCNTSYKYSKDVTIHQEVSTNNRLWGLYVDLEENLGTLESAKQAYEKMISNKFANVHAVLNYVQFLQEHSLWEDSFRVYEQGVNKFSWPHVYDIWMSYLNAFVNKYGKSKLERARDLFEQVLTSCPKDKIRIFYLLYSKLEEEYGLGSHIIEVFERAIRDVPDGQRAEMFLIYIQKVSDYFGVIKMRVLFEAGFSLFTNTEQIIDIGLKFANIERKLGEIDRVRTIYQYIAQFCDGKSPEQQKFWSKWNEFEIYHGNEDTYKEMMRVQRTSKFNTVGFNLADLDTEKQEE
jgi:pre-mRNA-splicing factor SYF1